MNAQAFAEFFVPVLGAILALVCLGFCLRAGKRQRLVENIPTSKTNGVFIGLVELKGTAEIEQPLSSYLAMKSCVFYKWSVQEHWSRTVTEHYTDSNGKSQTRTKHESGWKTVAEGGESVPFYLRDDCGVILVRPDGANIEAEVVMNETCTRGDPLYYGKGPEGAVMDSDHRRLFTENAILIHSPLYIMGQAREREDIVAAEIAADPQAPMYLISTRSEEQVGSSLSWSYWGLGFLGLVLAVAAAVARSYMLHRAPVSDLELFAVCGAAYLAVWFTGWVWMVFNSMVELRQRVRQAWSNVDVQLKRRYDLIPRLMDVVKGLRDYERQLQAELVTLRSQAQATPPGEPGADPTSCAASIRMIAERYPELKTSDAFMGLQQKLVDSENRISLARGYFNEIATFYNTRLEIIPDRFIAALAAMRPQTLMSADGFERVPVVVSLAE